MELEKLERRKWQPQWYHIEDVLDKKDVLDLPVPSSSPSVLNNTHDYQQKSNFLHSLGLRFVPSNIRNGKILHFFLSTFVFIAIYVTRSGKCVDGNYSRKVKKK